MFLETLQRFQIFLVIQFAYGVELALESCDYMKGRILDHPKLKAPKIERKLIQFFIFQGPQT